MEKLFSFFVACLRRCIFFWVNREINIKIRNSIYYFVVRQTIINLLLCDKPISRTFSHFALCCFLLCPIFFFPFIFWQRRMVYAIWFFYEKPKKALFDHMSLPKYVNEKKTEGWLIGFYVLITYTRKTIKIVYHFA